MTEVRERRTSGAVSVKRALIGRPRASGEMHETLLSKKLALPVFASDPLSSVAYATEAALVVLVAASASAAHLVLPISAAIARAAGDRRPLLPADGPRLRDERRRLRRRARQPRRGSRALSRPPRSSSTTSSRSPSPSPPGCSPSPPPRRRSRGTRSSSRSLCVVLLTLVNLRGVRESGLALRAADLRVRRGHVRPRRDRGREVRRPAPARRRTSPIRSTAGVGAVGAPRRAAGLRLRRRRRSPASRRSRTASAPSGRRRRKNAARTLGVMGADRDHALPRRLVPRGQDGRTPERERLARSPRSRARSFPASIGLVDALLRRPGADVRRSSSSPRTPRTRASRAWPPCSRATGSSRASS